MIDGVLWVKEEDMDVRGRRTFSVASPEEPNAWGLVEREEIGAGVRPASAVLELVEEKDMEPGEYVPSMTSLEKPIALEEKSPLSGEWSNTFHGSAERYKLPIAMWSESQVPHMQRCVRGVYSVGCMSSSYQQ